MNNKVGKLKKGSWKNITRRWVGVLALGFVAPVWSQICVLPLEKSAPNARFDVDLVSGVVIDTKTNLSWRRCAAGFEPNNQNTDTLLSDDTCDPVDDVAETYSWAEALEYANLEGDFWRLPNIKELASIVEVACISPALNSSVFPDAVPTLHWSSTPHAARDSDAWTVSFSAGSNTAVSKNTSAYVFLVRD